MLNWMNQVDEYLHQLNETANSVADSLIALEFATRNAATDDINHQCAKLGSLLQELQGRLSQRQALLIEYPDSAATAPHNLQIALGKLKHPKAAELHVRCSHIGSELRFIHQKAVGLFVGQFHLSNVTEEFLRLLSGVSAKPITYDQTQDCQSGTLLDRAA